MHPPTPISAPSTHVVFNKDFLYLLPIQDKGGAQSGEQDTGCWSPRGTVHGQTLRVDAHLPVCGCAQDSHPHPWTQGKHLQGSLGLGQRQGSPWTVCGPAALTSWGLLPSSPHSPVLSRELPVWDNLGIFFFSGGEFFCMTPHEQATPALLARCPWCGGIGRPALQRVGCPRCWPAFPLLSFC